MGLWRASAPEPPPICALWQLLWHLYPLYPPLLQEHRSRALFTPFGAQLEELWKAWEAWEGLGAFGEFDGVISRDPRHVFTRGQRHSIRIVETMIYDPLHAPIRPAVHSLAADVGARLVGLVARDRLDGIARFLDRSTRLVVLFPTIPISTLLSVVVRLWCALPPSSPPPYHHYPFPPAPGLVLDLAKLVYLPFILLEVATWPFALAVARYSRPSGFLCLQRAPGHW